MSQSDQAAAPGPFIVDLQYVDASQVNAGRYDSVKYDGVRGAMLVALYIRAERVYRTEIKASANFTLENGELLWFKSFQTAVVYGNVFVQW